MSQLEIEIVPENLSEKLFFAEIILPLSLPKTFTYSISETEYHFIQKGMRVAVPFGKNKIYTGLVSEKHRLKPTLYEAKEIHQIIDHEPIATEIQLKHWFWVADYYMCAIGDVFRCAFPSALLLQSETTIQLKKDVFVDESALSDDEFLICQAFQMQSVLSIQNIVGILNKKTVFPVIQKMIDKNIIVLDQEMHESYKPKLAKYIRLNETFKTDVGLQLLLEELKNAPKQKEIVLQFFQLSATDKKPILTKNLIESTKSTAAVVKSLIEKMIFDEYTIQIDRVIFNENSTAKALILSDAQQNAFQEIQQSLLSKGVCLLHGVTSSGKTEIYSQLIFEYLKLDKQILYLVPEIALTTQLVSRLQQFFGNSVAVFHSKYSSNERIEVWQKTLQNSEKAQIVVGARSALFLPFHDLGLIIVDEEHEQTFKQQEPSPRYHARDAAIVLANFHGAKVVLGSATPSLETFYNTTTDKFGFVTLSERFRNVALPKIEIVDLKDQYFRKKMIGHFSDVLIAEIKTALGLGEQVILFQNRRGYSPIIECVTCGHVPQCQNCNVSLTFHKNKNQLRCHYCGYSMGNPTNCHACSSTNLTTKGFGTEQIQQELNQLFPDAKIGRMDQDTTRAKFGFERIIDGFKNREIDILVGTQMVAKGLDFDNVTLVAIMNADNMLYHPDFRAFERSFQTMTQVAGRSGRALKQGKVLIQTYSPDHSVLKQVLNNDYKGMYVEQMHQRKIYGFPPYYRTIKITLKHREYARLHEGALWLCNVLIQNFQIPILGPEDPSINRIRNEFLKSILIKIPLNMNLGATKITLKKIINSFDTIPQFKAIKVVVNIDFY